MNSLHILEAGPMLTVQDLGRPGYLRFGVSGAGPMDRSSMRLANHLVGNEDTQAALEFASVGGAFTVETDVRFAVCGGSVAITIDGTPRHGWESHRLYPGETLRIGAMRGAVWGYLAISGGIDTPCVLGSRSTHLRSGLGGLNGRRLAAGDQLPLGVSRAGPLLALRHAVPRSPGAIRVVPGPQAGHFDARTWAEFLEGPFRVTPDRDRMAQLLEGPQIRAFAGHDIVSDGTVSGSIQIPSSGRPIVLMAERQTTGGYPKIATVASFDLPRLAQIPSGSLIRFRVISQDHAEDLAIARSRHDAQLLADLDLKPEEPTISRQSQS